ncbi:glycosyltransferase [Priestia megaterium]|uniref:Glycosyltransferase family 4 protein n=1 Tax=Priestia megaterium TaxID=1404 RepID=A0A3D8X2F8_PRIMG|nr:glycosyltransferase [Priestia megaterium]MDH3173998.1 glycosyltransferase [Priestia megaterium]RDZ14688.1 glycosyltransferase family 4 protein [Priestia megaterium]USL37374.1 glycosyltransferase [Priestia megaterium]
MKKIMFVIGVLSNGGAERVISTLSKEMSNQGYEVSIVTIFGDNNNYVDDKRIKLYPIKQSYRNKVLRGLTIVRKTRRLIKKKNPDMIVSFDATINIYTILSCMGIKNKLVVSERNDPYQNPTNKQVRKARDILYRFCNGFVFQTEDAKKYFMPDVQEKGTIIPNPIMPDLPYWEEGSHDKTIITASRLTGQKNLPMLIDAYINVSRRFPDYKLKIFGVGELREKLIDRVRELNLQDRVFFPGFSKDIHNEIKKSHLFVISSNYEGISNSMLEALAIGIPVISTDSPIGGAKMFIKDKENGILTRVGDTNQLSEAMIQILSNPKFAIKLSTEARKVREELHPTTISNRWIAYLREIYNSESK